MAGTPQQWKPITVGPNYTKVHNMLTYNTWTQSINIQRIILNENQYKIM